MTHFYKVFLADGNVEEIDAESIYIDEGVLYFIDNLTMGSVSFIDITKSKIVVVYADRSWRKVVQVRIVNE